MENVIASKINLVIRLANYVPFSIKKKSENVFESIQDSESVTF